jgi:L-asparaginase
MKIAVIFTGGTIGSTVKDGVANVDENAKYSLLCPFSTDPDIEFLISSPYSVLSENLSASEINLLQEEIEIFLEKGCDGIIVTHGTDTLQYAAVAAELSFCDAPIPIVFVSANFPLENPKTNGFSNFKAALEWIKAKKAGGVFVSFCNEGEKSTKIHIPTSLLRYREGDSNLFSLPSSAPKKKIGKVEYLPDSGILCIEARPGDGFFYSLEGVKAILFSPYHSSTLPTSRAAFCDFCHRAKKEGIALFVASFFNEVLYESTIPYAELGICPLPEPYISAYMKIWAAHSLGKPAGEFFQ